MKRLVHFAAAVLLGAAALVSCSTTPPPPPPNLCADPAGEFCVAGVLVFYNLAEPGELGEGIIGLASWYGQWGFCDVRIDRTLTGEKLAETVAHEVQHCAAFAFKLPGRPRPDLGRYYEDPREGAAQTYARAYVSVCGDRLGALKWPGDTRPCPAAPDARTSPFLFP